MPESTTDLVPLDSAPGQIQQFASALSDVVVLYAHNHQCALVL